MGEGTWALVTGASAGLGAAFARQLAARGHHVVLVARSEAKLEALAVELHERHGVDAIVVTQDLAAAGAAGRIADAVSVAGIQVEVLVNNAGIGTFGRDAEIDADYNRDVAMVNVVAVADLVQRFLPGMVARGSGAVVNVASMAGFQAQPYMSLYAATKAFVVNYSLGLWVETKGTGVRVLAVCPGPVDTDFPIANGIRYDEQRLGWLLADPAKIVAQSLRALDHDKGYVVPDWKNWPEAHLLPRRPRRLMTRLIGLVLRRFADYQRRLPSADDAGDREAVVALHAHGLHDGALQPRVRGDLLEVGPDALHVRVPAEPVGHGPAAHHVVGHDEAAHTSQFERPVEVVRVAALVGVDEDHVERLGAFGGQLRQGFGGGADADLHDPHEPGAGDVPARDLGVPRAVLQADEVPVRGQGPRHPDRAVTAERPDLQHALGALDLRQQVQELPLRGGHRDGRQPGALRGGGRLREDLVLADEQRREERVDFGPLRLAHGSPLQGVRERRSNAITADAPDSLP